MIPVFKPYIGADTCKAAVDALELGWLGMGSYVNEFEAHLLKYLELGSERKVIAVNTCTSALHLALILSGVGKDDEVITPALNNIGDFQAIGMCGAKPVLCDICEDDLGIDPDKIEKLIGPRTKTIIALHYTGVPCKIDKVFSVAKKHGLRVIEDAAHAIGTKINGKMVGSYGDLACYSFDAIKTLTCIDGGAVVVNNESEAQKLYPARLLGMTQSNNTLYSNTRAYSYDVTEQGFRYHLANLHASIGISQLKKLNEFIANRRKYCCIYNKLLTKISGLILPQSDFIDVSIFNYVIRVLNGERESLRAYLKDNGIDTGIHWVPANKLTWLKDSKGSNDLPVINRIGEEILTLPLWSYMDESIIEEICLKINNYYAK